jgi:hypothetical protein
MAKELEQTEVPYERMLQEAFIVLCAQYQEMGKQLEAIAILLGPLLDGNHTITPPVAFVPKSEKSN